MSRMLSGFMFACLAMASVGSAHAGPIARDAALVESLAVEGVSLATPPEEAFNLLIARGYSASGVTTYRDWTHGSLNLVRGEYGAPEGLSSITLGRADGRLALLTQTLNKRGIDVAVEMSSVQSHFSIGADDEPDCRLNRARTGGSCQLSDAADPTAARLKFTMTIQPTMILLSLSRPADLAKTLQ